MAGMSPMNTGGQSSTQTSFLPSNEQVDRKIRAEEPLKKAVNKDLNDEPNFGPQNNKGNGNKLDQDS